MASEELDNIIEKSNLPEKSKLEIMGALLACDEANKYIPKLESEIEAKDARIAELEEIIKAVAHIGIDFGYGVYELEQKHIDKARELYEAAEQARKEAQDGE